MADLHPEETPIEQLKDGQKFDVPEQGENANNAETKAQNVKAGTGRRFSAVTDPSAVTKPVKVKARASMTKEERQAEMDKFKTDKITEEEKKTDGGHAFDIKM